ncbi:hypothetical protein H0R92_05550 [Treponema sp. OMZ 840]|uniref:hypothetical protein n=1 Tax=Treponema sp. OMZ 840 TaxID=244313 RepID=UPI003D94A728
MRKKSFLFCAGLFFLILQGCASIPTALPKERSVEVPELDGMVKISDIQYERAVFVLSQDQYYTLRGSDKKFVIFFMQPQKIKASKTYDFYNITLENDTTTVHPIIFKYVKAGTLMTLDLGHVVEVANTLPHQFSSSVPYTVVLGFPAVPGERFTRINFYGKIVEIDENIEMKGETFVTFD